MSNAEAYFVFIFFFAFYAWLEHEDEGDDIPLIVKPITSALVTACMYGFYVLFNSALNFLRDIF